MKADRESIVEECKKARAGGLAYLVKITAVDYVGRLQVVYFLRDLDNGVEKTLEVDLPPTDAWVPTVMDVFPAADWYERELSEMFGITIRGRHAGRLLLEKWNGRPAPLRKNFVWGEPYETEGS